MFAGSLVENLKMFCQQEPLNININVDVKSKKKRT